MENQTTNLPDVTEALTKGLDQPRTRKAFFGALAAVGFAAVGSAVLPQEAFAQSSGNTDVDIANFALTIEYFESEVFYPAALEAGILSGAARDVVAQLVDIEVVHRDALISAIRDLGGTPIPRPQFTLPEGIFANQQTFLEVALRQEQTDAGAFLGAAPMIQSKDFLASAGAISGAEGENVVAVGNLLGIVPPANEAFPQALTRNEVLARIAPFLGMGSMPDTGGPSPSGPFRAL